MRPKSTHAFLLLCFLLISAGALGQTTVNGTITDTDTNEGLIGVNVVVKGTITGTVTDFDGNFNLTTERPAPITLVFSIVGYGTQELEITESETAGITLALSEQILMGQEIVISASRFEESILQSPTSIEKMDIIAIRETPSANFYDALANIKGVDISTNSLTFKSVNARGFGANGNERFVQMIDGMDNQAPGLNFPVGNIVGISELDLESVELLPGASSALYGPNALNGILLMTSKSPFQYQGLSAYVRNGLNMIQSDPPGASVPPYLEQNSGDPTTETNFYQDYAIRYAKAFNNKVAIKLNASYLRAEDFRATDYRDQSGVNGFGFEDGGKEGNRTINPGYNGINVYGDDGAVPLSLVYTNPAYIDVALKEIAAQTGTSVEYLQSIIPDDGVSRTGYREDEMVNYTTESLKLNGAFHYRFSEDVEGLAQINWGTGSTVYTANNRFIIDNFNLSQIKLEVRGSNFFVRGYTTQENSGDTYSSAFLGLLLNETANPNIRTPTADDSNPGWFPGYTTAYLLAALPSVLAFGANPNDRSFQQANHLTARKFADGQTGPLISPTSGDTVLAAPRPWLQPGTTEYNRAIDSLRQISLPNGGALLVEESSMWQVEGMYNFERQIQSFELLVGGNFRQYNLNSMENLFALDDNGDEFNISEFGAYVQASDRWVNGNLRATGSLRFDKNENFDGQITPRIALVYTIAELHNIRASFQTGFRIPTTQDQFIDLDVVTQRLVGSNDVLKNRYNMFPDQNPLYTPGVVATARESQNPGDLIPFDFAKFKPEKVASFEAGYKSLIANKLMVDLFGYYSTYQDFIGLQMFSQGQLPPGIRDPDAVEASKGSGDPDQDKQLVLAESVGNYGVDINIETENVNSFGFGLGLDYVLPRNFTVDGNVTFNRIDNPEAIDDLPGFQSAYNTPEWRTNITFANREVVDNLGFGITWRYQDAFLWQSSFGSGFIKEFSTLDAQVSYKISSIKSILKLGASNLLNEPYVTSYGNPTVGGIYYVQLTFDEFLN